MNTLINIPEEWQLLVECLRCAIHDHPPPDEIHSAEWGVLLRQARQHAVHHFLFPWLAKQIPERFSSHAQIDEDSAPAAWRALALDHLQTTSIRQKQTAEILFLFGENQIDVIPLKGVWLSEAIYDEPSQRPMVDIDILVRNSDVEKAHALLSTLGYRSKRKTRESVYMCDDSYYHSGYRTFVELHWNVESKMTGDVPIPDIEKIWTKARSSTLLGQPVKEFTNEDLLSHLVQHILHHQLAMPIKGFLDIALLIKKHGDQMRWETVTECTRLWKTGHATRFVLKMISEIFTQELPEPMREGCRDIDNEMLATAIHCIFELPEASQRRNEHNLLKYRDASAIGRIKLATQRIFMPKPFMVMHYPFARHTLLLPFAWFLRSLTLIINTGLKISSANSNNPHLENAAIRETIIKKLTRFNE